MDRFLTGFIWLWVGLILLLNLMAIAGAFFTSDFWATVRAVQEWYSPFNIWRYGLILILVLPAIGAYLWREKRRTGRSS